MHATINIFWHFLKRKVLLTFNHFFETGIIIKKKIIFYKPVLFINFLHILQGLAIIKKHIALPG